jgi:hypothetical protein
MNTVMNIYPESRRGSAAAQCGLVAQPILAVPFHESPDTNHVFAFQLSTLNFQLLFTQALRRSHLDASRGRRRGPLRPGGDGRDTRGKCRAEVHPISRYN